MMINRSTVIFLLASTLPMTASANTECWGWGQGWGHMWGGAGMFGGWMMWFWLVFLAIAAAFIFSKISNNRTGHYTNDVDDSPTNVLKTRLAKGEISESEYHALKKALET